jgi:hypothetical protein
MTPTESDKPSAQQLAQDEQYGYWLPEDTWTEILPGLWQGGTDDEDTIHFAQPRPVITREHFDTVVTLETISNPVDIYVRELRVCFHDAHLGQVDFDDAWFAARQAYVDWRAGRRVLIRCLSGLNRSGLIMGMVLLLAGYNAGDAAALMRAKRHRNVLSNADFEKWLLELDPEELPSP